MFTANALIADDKHNNSQKIHARGSTLNYYTHIQGLVYIYMNLTRINADVTNERDSMSNYEAVESTNA